MEEPYNSYENVNHPLENGTYRENDTPICPLCNKPLTGPAEDRVLVGDFTYAHRECRDADREAPHKWNVYVLRSDGQEERVYVHLTRERDVEQRCRDHFGTRFVKVVFKERIG